MTVMQCGVSDSDNIGKNALENSQIHNKTPRIEEAKELFLFFFSSFIIFGVIILSFLWKQFFPESF